MTLPNGDRVLKAIADAELGGPGKATSGAKSEHHSRAVVETPKTRILPLSFKSLRLDRSTPRRAISFG